MFIWVLDLHWLVSFQWFLRIRSRGIICLLVRFLSSRTFLAAWIDCALALGLERRLRFIRFLNDLRLLDIQGFFTGSCRRSWLFFGVVDLDFLFVRNFIDRLLRLNFSCSLNFDLGLRRRLPILAEDICHGIRHDEGSDATWPVRF